MPSLITSSQNPKVRHAARLRDRRYRDRHNESLVEGYRELRLALDSRHPVSHVFYCPALFLGENNDALLDNARLAGARLIETTPAVFAKISYRDRPDGFIGVAGRIGGLLDDLDFDTQAPVLLVAESIEKPGNLGAMLRSADGAAVDAVIVCDRQTDINNPNVIRASVGTIFAMPVVEASTAATISFLKAHAISAVIATPAGETPFWSADYTLPTAIVVGSEQYGVSDAWLDAAGTAVSIPMQGAAESLNVATATSILLYETVRQRGFDAAGNEQPGL